MGWQPWGRMAQGCTCSSPSPTRARSWRHSPAKGRSPFEEAAASEDRARIQAALDEIPPIFREVLVLRFQEQMKLEEIAKLVGIPLATVKTRLYRGVQALRPALGGGAQ